MSRGGPPRPPRWRDVWVLYRMELRCALRERSIIVGSVLVPLLLYPLMMWGVMTGLTYVMGQSASTVSRVAAFRVSEMAPLVKRLAEDERIEIVSSVDGLPGAREALRRGELDAVVSAEPGERATAARLSLVYDAARDRSARARERIRETVEKLRSSILLDELIERGGSEAEWQLLWVGKRNLATSREMGAFLMGLMVPMFMIIMVSVGALYPAVDSTAGERERGTWETLMSSSASTSSIVTAKYLYVTTMGTVAGLLNLAAMLLSMRAIFAPIIEASGRDFSFVMPLSAIPVIVVGTLLLALLVAAGMMVLASFARTFKEGQSLASPLYVLSFLPLLFINSPGIELDVGLALIPVVNIALVFREAIAGQFSWMLIALSIAVELLLIVLMLSLARWTLRHEDVLVGTYSGSLPRLVRDRLLRRKTR